MRNRKNNISKDSTDYPIPNTSMLDNGLSAKLDRKVMVVEQPEATPTKMQTLVDSSRKDNSSESKLLKNEAVNTVEDINQLISMPRKLNTVKLSKSRNSLDEDLTMKEQNTPRLSLFAKISKKSTQNPHSHSALVKRRHSILVQSKTHIAKDKWTTQQKASLQAIIDVGFRGQNERTMEEDQLRNQVAIMEEVKENIDIKEGIFIFRRKSGICKGLQIPVDEIEYLKKYQAADKAIHLSAMVDKEMLQHSLQKKVAETRREQIVKKFNQQITDPDNVTLQRSMTLKSVDSMKGQQEWENAQKIVVYDGRSLYLFHHKTWFRRFIVAITEDKLFENFILLLIILNSICLIIYDYQDRDNEKNYNKTLENGMKVFTYCFIGEAVLKVISMGFIQHQNSYLRDSWNWLDFIVVITSLIELIFDDTKNFKGLRTLRVFRPLRSINQFPAMKRLIRSLGASAGPLTQAVFFLSVIFILFSTLGVNQFQGAFYQRCRLHSEPVNGTWPYDKSVDKLCSKGDQGYQCEGMVCGTPQDWNLSLSIDDVEQQPLINYGVTTFDNVLLGFILIFQMITLEGWVYLMYDLQDAGQPRIATIFCVSIVVSCSYFLLNVILAVLAESIEETSKEDFYEIKKQGEIQKSLLRARAQGTPNLGKEDTLQSFLDAADAFQGSQTKRISQMSVKSKPNYLKWVQNERQQKEIKEELARDNQELKDKQTLEPSGTIDLTIEIPDRTFHDEISDSDSSDNNFQAPIKPMTDPDYEKVDDPEQALQVQWAHSMVAKRREKHDQPKHIGDNPLLLLCYQITSSSTFNFLFILITLANTVVLASYYRGISREWEDRLDLFERIFRWLFFVEMWIKLGGLGFKGYVVDGFNVLEAILVAISMVEEGFHLGDFQLEAGAFTAFRALRLLRVFRLARSWKTLHELVNMMEKSIKEITTFSILLLIMMVIFLLLGRELFAHRIKFKGSHQTHYGQTKAHQKLVAHSLRSHFDTATIGFITIFIIIIGDDWNKIMNDHYRALYVDSPGEAYVAVAYFMGLYIVGNIVLLNLFLAILLANFNVQKGDDYEDIEDSDIENDTNPCVMFWVWLRLRLAECFPKYLTAPPIAEATSESSSFASNSESIESESPTFKSVTLEQPGLTDMFQIEEEQSKKDKFEQKMLKIREEQEEKRRLKAEEQKTQLPVEFQEQPRMITTVQNSPQDKLLKTSQNLDEKEGGDSDSESSRKESERSKSEEIKNKKVEKKPKQQRRSTTVLALIQIHKIKAVKRRAAAAARLQKLKAAKSGNIADLKLQEMLRKSVSFKAETKKLYGKSLNIFSVDNAFRNFLSTIENSNWFSSAVLVSIMISTLILILENPTYDPKDSYVIFLEKMNKVMTVIFILEACVKITVYGFVCNGAESYCRSIWNIMDFIIVIFSSMDMLAFFNDAQFIKVMRLLRILRPLSLVGRNPGMKTVIQSLNESAPEIANLLLVSIMILTLYSILGTIFFKGLFWHCHLENIPEDTQSDIHTIWECFDNGGEWINANSNFDNVFSGLLTMFEIITTEGWTDIMWQGVDATKYNLMPETNANLASTSFFIIAMIIGSLFLLNLFVGVVINNFNIEKEKIYKNYLLTPVQQEYCDLMAKCYRMKPKTVYVSLGNHMKDFLYYVTINPAFEHTISISIILNTVCMGVSWYDEPQELADKIEKINFAFTVVFTIEAIIKITVQTQAYFQDGWSVFDFLIVISSWLDFAWSLSLGSINSNSALSLFRSFRVARLLRMIKRFKSLRKIFNTFVKSLRQLSNVAALLLLILLLYAVLGVEFFHGVKYQKTMDEHANFRTFGIAMLTLLRMTTGEAWNDLMHDASRKRSILFQCKQHPSVIKMHMHGQDIGEQCGSPVGQFYFISFMLIVSIIFLNMFIAIILEGFGESQQDEVARIKDETYEIFADCWQNFDPTATGFIAVADLELLISNLISEELKRRQGSSIRQDIMFNLSRDSKLLLYVKMQNELKASDEDEGLLRDLKNDTPLRRAVIRYMNKFISSLQVPTYSKLQHYQFHDTLGQLIKYVFTQQHLEQFEERQVRKKQSEKTGIVLYKWDKMQEKSIAFYKLPTTDQELFLELSCPDFNEVVARLEGKSVTNEERIQRVELMRTLRRQQGKGVMDMLDHWDGYVMDSSLIVGAKTLVKFVIQWKERRRQRLIQEADNCNQTDSDCPSVNSQEEQQYKSVSAPKTASLVISDSEIASRMVNSPKSFTQIQLPDHIELQEHEIVVERTIIEKSRYIIPNSQLNFQVGSLNSKHLRSNSDISKNISRQLNTSSVKSLINNEKKSSQVKLKILKQTEQFDDGGGGARANSPLSVNFEQVVAKIPAATPHGQGDGDGSKGFQGPL